MSATAVDGVEQDNAVLDRLKALKDKVDMRALQKLSFALMLPLAILPAAGICLALGISFEIEILEAVGNVVFTNLPILFALGIAVGMTGEGTVSLSVITGYLMLNAAMGVFLKVTPEMVNDKSGRYASVMGIDTLQTGVLGGLIVAAVAVVIYKRFHTTELPSFLAFFNGKRLVPILVTCACLALGYVLPLIWVPIQNGMSYMSEVTTEGSPLVAAYVYGFVERLLVPTGLHHIWNTPFYWNFGEYVNADGMTVTGDIPVFFAQLKDGAPLTGALFMTGRFPIMMFALPALGLAIYHEAKPENRETIKGLLISGALTSALTGITEPIEYSFLFAAPILFFVHAIFYASSFVVMSLLDVHVGHPFAGGGIDFVINGVLQNRTPWWWVPIVGMCYAVIYYFGGRFLIRKFNLRTPGRESEAVKVSADATSSERSHYILEALGGRANITSVDACASRLRLGVNDSDFVDEARLKELGAFGLVKLGKQGVQVIFGGKSQNIAVEIENILKTGATHTAEAKEVPHKALVAVANGKVIPLNEVPDPVFSSEAVGVGIGLEPTDGTFVSPVDGEVMMVFDTGHAYGIATPDGVEVLVHIGIDTVTLSGKGFTPLVKAGDKVSVGTPICEADLAVIKEAGLSTITPVLVTNKTAISDLTILPGEVKAGETDAATFALAPVNA